MVDRHFLHAFHLGFNHPASGEPLEFKTDLPPDLAPAVDALRAG
jgi:23S rRNA pseudouridine1911/1915/1917 synthase